MPCVQSYQGSTVSRERLRSPVRIKVFCFRKPMCGGKLIFMTNGSTPQENPLRKLERFLGRPLIVSLFGLVCMAIGVLATWYFTESIEPTYHAWPADTVARRESPRLTVAWDGTPIENLCVCRVALWNWGNKSITQDRFTTSDPLRIQPTKNIRILEVEMANSKRPTLTLDTQIVKSEGGDNVHLSIHGGDAFDKGEGVALRLLFTGDCKTDFIVTGRVTGTNGFQTTRIIDDSPREVVRRGLNLTLLMLVFVVLIPLLISIPIVKSLIQRPQTSDIMIIAVPLTLMFISALVFFASVRFASSVFSLPWLPQSSF
jgi:hypothetical protein